MKFKKRHLRIVSRRFWGTAFSILIAVAVLVQLGREAFPLLNDYRSELSATLSRAWQVDVQIGEISATWAGLKPKIVLDDVTVQDQNGSDVFTFSRFTGELGIVESIMQMRLFWLNLEFEGFKTTLLQQESGSWKLHAFNGSEQGSTNRYDVDDPLDVMLIGRRVKLKDTSVSFLFKNGRQSDIRVPNISIDNDDDFLRILADAELNEVDHEAMTTSRGLQFKFVLEGHGNPKDATKFSPSGYAYVSQLHAPKILSFFTDEEKITENFSFSETEGINLQFWFKGLPHLGMTFRGLTQLQGIDFKNQRGQFNLEAVSSEFIGKWHLHEDWEVNLRNTKVLANNISVGPLDIDMKGLNAKLETLRIKELDAKPVNELLLSTGFLGDEARKKDPAYILSGLNPTGKVKNVAFTITDKENDYFSATATVVDGHVTPVLGVPGIEKVNATVKFSALSGYADLASTNGFNLIFPGIYDHPLSFDTAHGRVSWDVDVKNRIAHVNSNTLRITNKNDQAKGHMNLFLPFSRQYGEQKMTLAIGMKNADAKSQKALIPSVISPELYDWLHESVNEGQLVNSQFIYHGSIAPKPTFFPTIQLSSQVLDGNLVFDTKWPELEKIRGKFLLDNSKLDVQLTQAEILGNSVNNAQVKLVEQQGSKDLSLSIKGGLSSQTSAALDLLQASPIGEVIGNAFEEWAFTGQVATNVELLIPLSADGGEASHRVDAAFVDSGIHIKEIDITVDKIKGQLFYDTQKGFSSTNLVGEIWGEAMDFNVFTDLKSESADTIVEFSSMIAMDDLIEWTQFPELKFLEGESRVDGEIMISGQKTTRWPVTIDFNSQLVGVALNLPTPYTKVPDDAEKIEGKVFIGEGESRYYIDYGEQIHFALENTPDLTYSGVVSLGQKVTSDLMRGLSDNTFLIRGDIPYFKLEEWLLVGETYEQFRQDLGVTDAEDDTSSTVIEAKIGKLDLLGIDVPEVSVSAIVKKQGWDIGIDSETASGFILLPADDVPSFDLSYIEIDEGMMEQLASGGNENTDKDFDLEDLESFDFQVGKLRVKEKDYGRWAFSLRKLQNEAVITGLLATAMGIDIGDAEKSGEIRWRKNENGDVTTISLPVNIGDIGEVIATLYDEKPLQSKAGFADIALTWNDSPLNFDLEKLTGTIIFNLERGSFIRGAESGETDLLQLLALFNFDTLARRLKLDFSDLAAKGLSYDKVEGQFDFADGNMYLKKPLVVKSSSSKINLAGTIDLVEEEIDGELVVTLPVAGNAAAIAGLVAGLPAAIGVYVFGKLFKKQVDKLSSLSYNVSGNWDDPKIKFNQVFDDEAANRKADSLESKPTDSEQADGADAEKENQAN